MGAHAPSRAGWKARPRAGALRYGGALAETNLGLRRKNASPGEEKCAMTRASSPRGRALPRGGVRANTSALRFVVRTVRVGEQRFDFLLQKQIAGAGAFYHGRSPKRIIAFDGIGQNRFYLLPALRSHFPDSFQTLFGNKGNEMDLEPQHFWGWASPARTFGYLTG